MDNLNPYSMEYTVLTHGHLHRIKSGYIAVRLGHK